MAGSKVIYSALYAKEGPYKAPKRERSERRVMRQLYRHTEIKHFRHITISTCPAYVHSDALNFRAAFAEQLEEG
jgi:hypothetical protein